jgi:hydroxyacylglutathione hydrolase
VVIDPVDSDKILSICEAEGVTLVAILTTHYHGDHSGGNAALVDELPDLTVYAGRLDADRTPGVTDVLKDGEQFVVASLPFRCIATPCHTKGHVCYYLDASDGQSPALFSGDTLFVAGCGRFMEGGPREMRESLRKLFALPLTTRVFCGHEYTVSNLQYALSLEPSSQLLIDRLEEAEARREAGLPTVPSTLAAERTHNPFVRGGEASIAIAVGCAPGDETVDVLGKLRRKKDTFTTMGKVITLALDVQSMFQRN